jgi:hypothetical protein
VTTESPRWFKSSYSNNGGDCVEVATNLVASHHWFKSSYSNNGGNCIEVAADLVASRGVVPVRDSKNPDGPALGFETAAWSSFVGAVKGGEFPA